MHIAVCSIQFIATKIGRNGIPFSHLLVDLPTCKLQFSSSGNMILFQPPQVLIEFQLAHACQAPPLPPLPHPPPPCHYPSPTLPIAIPGPAPSFNALLSTHMLPIEVDPASAKATIDQLQLLGGLLFLNLLLL